MSLFPLNGYCYRRLEKITIWKMQHVIITGCGNREPTQGIDREVPKAISLIQNWYHWKCWMSWITGCSKIEGFPKNGICRQMVSSTTVLFLPHVFIWSTEVNNAIVFISDRAQALCSLTEAELREKCVASINICTSLSCKRWCKHMQFQQKK